MFLTVVFTFTLFSSAYFQTNCHDTCQYCRKDLDRNWCISCETGEEFVPGYSMPTLIFSDTGTNGISGGGEGGWVVKKTSASIHNVVDWWSIDIDVRRYTASSNTWGLTVGPCTSSATSTMHVGYDEFGWGYIRTGKKVHDSWSAVDYALGYAKDYTITMEVDASGGDGATKLSFKTFHSIAGYRDHGIAYSNLPNGINSRLSVCVSWSADDAYYVLSNLRTIGECRCSSGEGRVGTGPCDVCSNHGAYYLLGQSCLACATNCAACTGSGDKCTACKSSYVLKEGACVSSCGDGWWLDGSTCRQCGLANCKTCSSSSPLHCSRCIIPRYLSTVQNKCVTSCDAGYYEYNSNGGICFQCYDNDCIDCTGPSTTCVSCGGGKYATPTGTCETTCPLEYYADTTLGACVSCPVQHCETCYGTNGQTCQTCVSPRLVKENVCVTSCGIGYYESAGACLQCDDTVNCEECSGPGEKCTKCGNSLFAKNGVCVSSCGDFYFTTPGTCTECSTTWCKTCPSDVCTECGPSRPYLQNGNCRISCTASYWLDSATSQCFLCDVDYCAECEDETGDCLSCDASFTYESVSKTCLCPAPKFVFEGICQDCTVENCAECLTDVECKDCAAGYYKSAQTCLACDAIMSNCETCESSVQCETCAAGYYVHASSGMCSACLIDNCASCDPDETNRCFTCDDGYTLLGTAWPNQCYICSEEKPDCEECESAGGSFISCLRCGNNKFYNGVLDECVDSCEDPYQAEIDGLCVICGWECKSCSRIGYCDECNGHFVVSADGTSCEAPSIDDDDNDDSQPSDDNDDNDDDGGDHQIGTGPPAAAIVIPSVLTGLCIFACVVGIVIFVVVLLLKMKNKNKGGKGDGVEMDALPQKLDDEDDDDEENGEQDEKYNWE